MYRRTYLITVFFRMEHMLLGDPSGHFRKEMCFRCAFRCGVISETYVTDYKKKMPPRFQLQNLAVAVVNCTRPLIRSN
jgi:hypothetical protein